MKEYCIWKEGRGSQKEEKVKVVPLLCQRISYYFRITDMVVFHVLTFCLCYDENSELSCQSKVHQVREGQHLHLSGWVDSAALVFCSQSQTHPPSVPCASCRSCCQWQWTSQSSQPQHCTNTNNKAQGLLCSKKPSVATKQRVSKWALLDAVLT